MSNINLNNAMKIVWEPSKCAGGHSVKSGDYRIHKSGSSSYTVYKLNPFVNLGHAKTADEAKALFQEHSEK